MSEEGIPLKAWQKALISCFIMAAIAGVAVIQADPEASLKSAGIAFFMTLLVHLKDLFRPKSKASGVLSVF